MEVKIRYLEGHKFEAESRRHKIIIDQPKEKGGSDEGFNPLEVFLASVGSCAAFYAKMYCQNAGIDAANLEVNVSSSLTADKPLRFQDIEVKLNLGRDIAERKNALLSFAANCPVHNTVKAAANIRFII